MAVSFVSFFAFVVTLALVDSSKGDDTWTVYYWGAKNRGNFIRLLFEWRGVPYTFIDDYDTFSKHFAAWDDGVFEKSEENVNSYHSPLFAPPAIRYKDPNSKHPLFLSQTAAAMEFVANKLDIGPKLGTLQDFEARKIVLDCFDISSEIYALSKGGDFRGYSMDDMKKYVEERFEKWMNVLEFPLHRTNGFLFGNNENELTYADFAVFNVMDGLMQLFGNQLFTKIMNEKHSKLVHLYETILKLPSINAFIKKQNDENVGWFNTENIVKPMQQSLFPQYDVPLPKTDL